MSPSLVTSRAGAGRLFLWVHLFEPHAPYGEPRSGRPVADRYDDEIAESDAQVGRILDALGPDAASTLVVVASDHGEAFGEHGEVSHSLFVYDTTLRVPLIVAGPGVPARTVSSPVSLVDVAPTVLRLLGVAPFDSDGVDLSRAFGGAGLPARDLYAESFAPLLDFGWSPLRALRSERFKYIEAPRAELYDTARDPGEAQDLSTADVPRAAELRDRVGRYSTATLDPDRLAPVDREALGRLQSLGYASGSGRDSSAGARPDPKDRRAIAARLSEVISGELQGPALEAALRRILDDDPKNPQANLRLGYVLLEASRCAEAVPFLRAAIAAKMPTADAHLGLGVCQAAARTARRGLPDPARGRTHRARQPRRLREPGDRVVRDGATCRRDHGLQASADARPRLPRSPLQPRPRVRASRTAPGRRARSAGSPVTPPRQRATAIGSPATARCGAMRDVRERPDAVRRTVHGADDKRVQHEGTVRTKTHRGCHAADCLQRRGRRVDSRTGIASTLRIHRVLAIPIPRSTPSRFARCKQSQEAAVDPDLSVRLRSSPFLRVEPVISVTFVSSRSITPVSSPPPNWIWYHHRFSPGD